MIADVGTMIRKEALELVVSLRGRGRVSQLLILGVFGVIVPARTGDRWVDSKIGLLIAAWAPMLLVISLVADAFAGERERHTLETLLASRLPDRAILFGKILTIAAYGWLAAIAVSIAGLIVVNLKVSGGLVHFSAAATAAGIAFALLTSLLASTVGALVSLRAATVRQAQQLLSAGVVVIAIIPGFGAQLLPSSWRSRISDAIDRFGGATLVVVVLVALTVVTAVLLRIAVARFQRGRLLLV
jgi:ABC-2 type transport system permease protein